MSSLPCVLASGPYVSLGTNDVSNGSLISSPNNILKGLNPKVSVLGADLIAISTVGKRRCQLFCS